LISRAVEQLDPNSSGESRRAIYGRARAALIAQLRSVQPPLPESEITEERLALEEAVRKVESAAAQRAREFARKSKPSSLLTREDLEQARQRGEEDARRLLVDADRLRAEELEARLRAEKEARRLEEEARLRAEEDERVLRNQRAAIPSINAIPEQNLTRAIGFSPTRRGPLDLVSDPPTDPYDLEQSMLYSRIRQQLEKLKDDVPYQERTQVNAAIDDFLSQPENWSEVEHKKVLWLSGNSLRALLAQHDAVRADPEHYSKLPPSVAEAMRSPVQAWSIFVQGDPALSAGGHALPYLEFVANNPALIKEYIRVVFQNTQMIEIVDALEFEYRRIRNRL
jgi:hypothetical protein